MVAQIPAGKARYADLGEFLQAYRSIVGTTLRTPDDFRRAAEAVVRQAGNEGVHYLEIREAIHDGKPEPFVRAIEKGMRSGAQWVAKRHGFKMGTALILCAVRNLSPEESLATAQLAVRMGTRKHSLVRGFDLAGGEANHPVTEHADAIKYFAEHGKPIGLQLTVHAGETDRSGKLTGAGSVNAALDLGADRIGHGLQFALGLSRGHRSKTVSQLLTRFARDRIPIELNPMSNYKIGGLDTIGHFPLQPLLDRGLNVSLSTDDPTFFTRSQRPRQQQLYQLWRQGVVTDWSQVKQLTLNGIRSGFGSLAARQRIERQVVAEFARIEKDPAHHETIRKYLSHDAN